MIFLGWYAVLTKTGTLIGVEESEQIANAIGRNYYGTKPGQADKHKIERCAVHVGNDAEHDSKGGER